LSERAQRPRSYNDRSARPQGQRPARPQLGARPAARRTAPH
ncbi:MAG: hypothetical protein JWN87_427, partial [Frankiales bacterium]|nr:hypothetical protein [Frankiales bacterium]